MPAGISSCSRTSPVSGIHAPQITLVAFPRGVPELSVDPRHAGDEPVGRDGAKNRARFRIDLIDLPLAMMPHPQRSLGPREPRVAAIAGRRDGAKHAAGLRVDLLDLLLGELKEMLPVERRPSMCGDVDRAHHLTARRIERGELVSGGEPHVLTVVRDSAHIVETRKRSVLTGDVGFFSSACFRLVDEQRSGE